MNLCRELELTVTPATYILMKNATGSAFPIDGITSFKVSNKNNTEPIEVEALVVDGLNHPLLISWLVCVQLRLIHPTFPLASIDDYYSNHKTNCSFVTVNNASSLKIDILKLLINEFPDVIHDTINPRIVLERCQQNKILFWTLSIVWVYTVVGSLFCR